MKRLFVVISLIFAATILAAVPEETEEKAPVPTYVGVRKCKVCHLSVFKSWHRTGHAHALDSLEGKERENPTCLSCHTTGYGKGGYGAKETVVDLSSLQCEACHGPGSLYSRSSVMRKPELSHELGLRRINAETCKVCHNETSPTFRLFNYQEFLKTGTH